MLAFHQINHPTENNTSIMQSLFAQTVIQPTPFPTSTAQVTLVQQSPKGWQLPFSISIDPHQLNNPNFYVTVAIIIAIVGAIGLALWALDQLLAPISAMQHGMVGIVGKRGSGKSFTAVTYARRWRHFNPHKPVYTNLEKLELPGDGPVYLNCTHEQITKAYNGLLLIDEAGVWLNAWNFVEKDQRKVARWIAATRHYKVMVILTAHAASHINVRVRSVVDEWIAMTPFTTLKLFRGLYYESESSIGRPKAESHTVWVPMWASTCKSYNTDSLHKQAISQGVDMVGTDAEIPGMAGMGARGIDSLKPSGVNNYPAITPPSSLDTLLASIEDDPSKIQEKVRAAMASSKTANTKETTTVIDVTPATDTTPAVVETNGHADQSSLEEWEIWINKNATDDDLSLVRKMQGWFQSGGGSMYEIELPNVGAYKIGAVSTNGHNQPTQHYDSRTLVEKLLHRKSA
jgi:hypothetical protein